MFTNNTIIDLLRTASKEIYHVDVKVTSTAYEITCLGKTTCITLKEILDHSGEGSRFYEFVKSKIYKTMGVESEG